MPTCHSPNCSLEEIKVIQLKHSASELLSVLSGGSHLGPSLSCFLFPLKEKLLWGALPSPRESSFARKIKLFSWTHEKSSKKMHMTTTSYTKTPGWVLPSFLFLSHLMQKKLTKHSLGISQIYFVTIGYSLSEIFYFSFLLWGTNYTIYFVFLKSLDKYCFNIPLLSPLPTSNSSDYQKGDSFAKTKFFSYY